MADFRVGKMESDPFVKREDSWETSFKFGEKDKENKPVSGIAGGAFGYNYTTVQKAGTAHGIHVDGVLFSSALSLGLLNPALKLQANLGGGSKGMAVDGGIVPQLHILLPGVLQMYAGLGINGVAGGMNGKGISGYSVNPVLGGQVLLLYGEYTFAPIAGSEHGKADGLSIGLRLGF